MAGLQVFIVWASIFTAVSGSHMQGGTVSFKAMEKTQTGWLVDFTYKSSFIDGYGGPFYWGCLSGDCGVELNHWSQPVENRTSFPSRWYQYEGHIRRRVDSDKYFQLWERSCCWVANMYNIGGWQLTTSVDLGVRSDTQKPNSSPVTTIIPIIRVPQNCATTVHLLGHDPDGDQVTCRYGYYNGECESCYWDFDLDHNKCTMFIPAWISPGFYVEQFILEDFPKKNIYLTYNDGTKIYRYRPFSRKSRELPKDYQKYYWYGTTESVTMGSSQAEMITDGIQTSILLLSETPEQETSAEPLPEVKTSPHYYITEAITDIFQETTTEGKTSPHYYISKDMTTPHYYMTEAVTDISPETTWETLPDIKTTPHYYITEATTDTFDETTREPFPEEKTTPHYYITKDSTDIFEETSMEPLTDIKTTPRYYITEAITDIFQETTTEVKTSPHYYITNDITTPHYYITEDSTDIFDETSMEPLPDIKTTPRYYITEAITDIFQETTTEVKTSPHYYITNDMTTPHYYITEGSTDIFEETSMEPLPDIKTTPRYYITEAITDIFQETTTEVKTSPHYYITNDMTTPHYYITEGSTDIFEETTTEPLEETTMEPFPDIKTTPHYYITEAITDIFEGTTREPLPEIKTTPYYYTTELVTDIFEETTREPLEETTMEPFPDIKTTPKYYSTEATKDIFEETTREPLPDIKTTPHYYITEAVTHPPRRTTSVFEETTQHILTTTMAAPYETTGWEISPTVLPNNMDSLSRISLQFIVEVTNRAPSCTFGDYRPKFILPTPLQGEQLRTNVGRVFQLHLSAQAAYESVSDFKVSGPPGITKTFTHKSRSTTKSMVAEWRPSENHVGDHVPFCFVAETSNGYQSEMRCVIVVVGPSNLDTIQLTCHENTMTLIAAKSSDHELYENQFRLNDPKCLVSSNSTHLVASVAYNSCGTETEETDHDIVFKNQATSFRDKSSVITRKHGVSIPFNCSFPKKTRVSASFRVHKSDYVFSEAGFGNFTYKFQFYTDDLFEEVETEYPLEVTLRELLFMEIQVSSSVPNVQLFVESCKATPHDNPNDPTFYGIIQNGCIMDETFVVYSSTRTQYRFAMEAFAFMGDYSEVYMSCTVILCKLGEPGTRCTKGCITKSLGDSNRRRRSVSSESQQHYISQGPITMKRSLSNTDLGGSPSLNVNTLVISLSGVVIVALLGFTVHTYMKRSRVSGYELVKTQDF